MKTTSLCLKKGNEDSISPRRQYIDREEGGVSEEAAMTKKSQKGRQAAIEMYLEKWH